MVQRSARVGQGQLGPAQRRGDHRRGRKLREEEGFRPSALQNLTPPRCDGSRLSLSRPVCLRATVQAQGSQEGKGAKVAKVAKKAIIGRHLSQLVANAVGQHQAYELALAITALDPNGLRVFERP